MRRGDPRALLRRRGRSDWPSGERASEADQQVQAVVSVLTRVVHQQVDGCALLRHRSQRLPELAGRAAVARCRTRSLDECLPKLLRQRSGVREEASTDRQTEPVVGGAGFRCSQKGGLAYASGPRDDSIGGVRLVACKILPSTCLRASIPEQGRGRRREWIALETEILVPVSLTAALRHCCSTVAGRWNLSGFPPDVLLSQGLPR